MKRFSVVLLCSVVAVLAGCAAGKSQVPVAITYDTTKQHKMQAAHHWDVLAEYETENILQRVKDNSKPIYVEPPAPGASAFDRAYHDMLQEHLVRKCALVVTEPTFGAIHVSYTTQILSHNDRGYLAPAPGTYTALGAGAAVVGVTAANAQPAIWAAVPLLVGMDIFSGGWAKAEPTEVIITTVLTEGNLILMTDTDVFYYNPGDSSQYLSQMALNRGQVFQVVDK